MKKSSKLISLLLALVIATSCFAGFSAFSAMAAEGTTKIYFRLPEDVWGESPINEAGKKTSVYCHLYAVYGDDEMQTPAWQAKAEKCTYDESLGLYYYDVEAKLGGMKEGADYACLFSTDTKTGKGNQTGNITLSTECYGATAIVTGEMVENTEDSEKLDYAAVWDDPALAAKYGPMAAITSKGNIIGQYFPVYQPKEQIMSRFLKSWAVINATIITPEIVQADCVALGVDPMDVYNQYAADYAAELADPEAFPNTASLEVIATLLGVDPNATEEPTTEVPTTEAPTTEEPTTEAPTTEAPTTEEPTTEAPTTEEPTTEAPTTEAPTTEAPTTEPVALYGDVDGDGMITVADATMIQKMGINMIEVNPLGDVNGDGRVSIMDVTLVQKYVAELGYNTGNVGQPAV